MNSDKVRELIDAGKVNCPFCGTKPKQIKRLLRKIWRDYGKHGDISTDALMEIEKMLAVHPPARRENQGAERE